MSRTLDPERPSAAFPDRAQRHLLEACLLDGPRALEAWRAWDSLTCRRELDPGSDRLLPLLYQNLVRHGVDERRLDRLKAAYRVHWLKNARQLRSCASTLRALGEAGIETMLLKGVPLALLHFADPGVRPMDDVDVLVPRASADAAIDVLTRRGYVATPALERDPTRSPLHVHGWPFQAPDGTSVDLQWQFKLFHLDESDDRPIWAAARPLGLHGAATLAPCPADLLVQVCAHGLVWSPIPSIRWVADAVTVIRTSAEAIDWDRVVELARERHLALPLTRALGYLRQEFEAGIPVATLEALRALRVAHRDRIEYRLLADPPPESGLLESAAGLWRSTMLYYIPHRRAAGSTTRALWTFPSHLRGVTRAGRWSALATRALLRLRSRRG